MCGITGFLSEGEYGKEGKRFKEKMNSRIMSRGLMMEGYYVDEHIASCHAQAVDHRT